MVFTTKEEQLAAFSRLFERNLIKSRSQGGTDLMYFPVEVIRARLNEVFPASYDIRTGEILPNTDTLDMSTILTLRWCDGSVTVTEEWGSSDVLVSNSSGKRVNDPAKNAASDSLKRCCAAHGCGAELYNAAYRAEVAAELNKMPERKKRDFGAPAGAAPAPGAGAPPPSRFGGK